MYLHTKFHVYGIILTSFKRGAVILLATLKRIPKKPTLNRVNVQFQKVISEKCDLRHDTRNPPHRWDLEAKTWGPKVGTRDPYYT